MKTSDLLQRAKNYLWDGVERYTNEKSHLVCGAIILAVAEWPAIYGALAADVRIKIMQAMGDSMYVSQWLRETHKVPKKYLEQPKLIQEYRHRWLDHLIATYKEAGK